MIQLIMERIRQLADVPSMPNGPKMQMDTRELEAAVRLPLGSPRKWQASVASSRETCENHGRSDDLNFSICAHGPCGI